MKKLISVLSAIILTSISISSVVSCSVPSAPVNIKVNGNGDDISEFNSNLQSHLVPMAAYQLLNAITYTDTKYQDPEKREEFRGLLGEKGIALSLDDIFENNRIDSNDRDEFWSSYKVARNTRFTDFSFNTNNNDIGRYKIGDIKPYIQEVEVDSSKSESERITYGEIQLATKTLSEYATDEDTKDKLSSLNFDDIWMLGLDASDFTNSAPIISQTSSLVGNQSNNVEKLNDDNGLVTQEVTNNFELVVNENNVVNSNVFYYSNSLLSDINISFTDPGDSANDEKSFEINYSNLSGMIVRWQLGVASISTETNDTITNSELIYWFEPERYQFTLKPVNNTNTTNIFDNLNLDFDISIIKR